MNLSIEAKNKLIELLTLHVTSECSAVDMEERFCQTIDEIYSFDKVGGPFEHMSPSRVLKEMDPTAFRIGVSEEGDRDENLIEIDGDYYDKDEIEKARAGFVAELQGQLDAAQNELDEVDTRDAEDAITARQIKETIDRIEAEIEAATDHSF